MYFHFYLRKGTLFVPTVGKMEEGFYRDVEPVAAVPASDRSAVHRVLTAMVALGNPDVPVLKRGDWPPPVVLKFAGVTNWSAFERGMSLWGIEIKGGIFQIIGKQKKLDGSTVDDPKQTITFPTCTPVGDVIDRMIEIVQAAALKI